jgi:hypothetical protein
MPLVAGDRLQQVFWNLLSNARSSRAPGRIVVRAGKNNGLCEVTSDDGAGIDPAFLPHISSGSDRETAATAVSTAGWASVWPSPVRSSKCMAAPLSPRALCRARATFRVRLPALP